MHRHCVKSKIFAFVSNIAQSAYVWHATLRGMDEAEGYRRRAEKCLAAAIHGSPGLRLFCLVQAGAWLVKAQREESLPEKASSFLDHTLDRD